MISNKKASKIKKFLFCRLILSLKFVGTVSVSSPYDLASASIISSHIIPELSIILAKHLPFSQLHVAGFQI